MFPAMFFRSPWLLVFACIGLQARAAAEPKIDFSRDVLPILSDACFQCHGPEPKNRKADLRLDLQADALKKNKEGEAAIVPGKLDQSLLWSRITTHDEDDVMPPKKSNKKVTEQQRETLKRWIESGAEWGKHWAFEKPVKAALPQISDHKFQISNPVDVFIMARLKQEGLSLSPQASKQTLIRRATLDITGLPPSPEEVDAFLKDTSPEAYEHVVDRLLSSPHYGERMAMVWLDGARYADTDGYQSDDTRTNWPWRDWVIGAFNANMPYDQFTIEQFAGDLLPNATADQKLATCFHRNHMTNGEGGRDPEESRVEYVIDRMNTIGTQWLGLTLGCCQCHSHKFDPITQADYYGMSAYFNSIDEDGKAGKNAKPYLAYQSPHVSRAIKEAEAWLASRQVLEKAVRADSEKPFAGWLAESIKKLPADFQAWRPMMAKLESEGGTVLKQEADGAIQSSGPKPHHEDYRLIGSSKLTRITGLKLEVLPHASNTNGLLSRSKTGDFILTDIKVQTRRKGSTQVSDVLVSNAVADFSADKKKNGNYGDVKDTLDDDPRNGWSTMGTDNKKPHIAVYALAEPLVLGTDEELVVTLQHRSLQGQQAIGRFRVSLTDQSGEAVRSVQQTPLEALAKAKLQDAEAMEPKLRVRLFEQFLADHKPHKEAQAAFDRAKKRLSEVKAAEKKIDVMVLQERKEARETNVLIRGVWDKKGDKVERGMLPAVLAWPKEQTASRLDLAKWLVSRDNPLTARVAVNHLWQMLFGNGLVRTPDDFGLQGERPTHPELLDWLAVDFKDNHWDMKRMIKQLVMSQTYRQTSDAKGQSADPENKLLSRAPRYRLPAWIIRDSALKSAGLLNPTLGGPPVKPYQPDGIWEENFMGRFHYEPSEGPDQYRRTVYAFWRRSVAPTFLFDSAQRRVCEVKTGRTNTPLQALTLLNDETMLEASRVLAANVLHVTKDAGSSIREMVKRVLCREASEAEIKMLASKLSHAREYYADHPADAKKLLHHGQSPIDAQLNIADLAATSIVATMILNLDEAITRE
jgi:Protein of unknown function (DUF1549)/Protein of unknown function (DUF1553)/Planctomycete cytochrome C